MARVVEVAPEAIRNTAGNISANVCILPGLEGGMGCGGMGCVVLVGQEWVG